VKIQEIMAVMSMFAVSSFKVPRLGPYLHSDLHQKQCSEQINMHLWMVTQQFVYRAKLTKIKTF
jgi:hypothetical protein